MLRLRSYHAADSTDLLASQAQPVVEVVRDYADSYVELVRLLYEAANVEHALLVQYLAAGFSIKPEFAPITGGPMGPNAFSLFGVAIQEMQHLDAVNRLLTTLGVTPRMDRDDFPMQVQIYPFPLEILPLSEVSVARYVYAESPAAIFEAGADPADQLFAKRVLSLLGGQHVNHIGGLYTNILDRLGEVMSAPPPGVGDLSPFPDQLEAIKEQGEGPHFLFFRGLLEGTLLGLQGKDTWKDPASAIYPSLPLRHGLTAFAGDPHVIVDEDARRVAWLSNLHYWMTLSLLDMGCRFGKDAYLDASKSHMRGPLYQLGRELSRRGFCMPFDLPTLPIPWASIEGGCRVGVYRLAIETKQYATVNRTLLPTTFTFDAIDATIELLR